MLARVNFHNSEGELGFKTMSHQVTLDFITVFYKNKETSVRAIFSDSFLAERHLSHWEGSFHRTRFLKAWSLDCLHQRLLMYLLQSKAIIL